MTYPGHNSRSSRRRDKIRYAIKRQAARYNADRKRRSMEGNTNE